MIRRPPRSTLFPYTNALPIFPFGRLARQRRWAAARRDAAAWFAGDGERRASAGASWRSEEHTSELQSQSNLVCRLLLEKKKKKATMTMIPNINAYQRLSTLLA